MKMDRINPVTNLGNIFSLRSTARLGKSLIPATLVMLTGIVAVQQDVFGLPVLSLAGIPVLLHALVSHAAGRDRGILLGWSALDYRGGVAELGAAPAR